MKFGIFALVGLTIVGVLTQNKPVTAQLSRYFLVAQGIEPFELRSLVATVDPNRPIQISVINQSELTVKAQLMKPASEERDVPNQGSVTFGRLHTSYLPLPINLTVYPINTTNYTLNGDLEVVNNEIIVTVTKNTPETGPGIRSIRVDEAGNIYLP